MDKFALVSQGKTVGEVFVTEEGLYRCFRAKLFEMPEGLHTVTMVGQGGAQRLGVLERKGRGGDICRRFSKQMLRPLGRILSFELGQAGDELPWLAMEDGQEWWRKVPGSRTKLANGRRLVALAYNARAPFPWMDSFCFCKPMVIEGAPYLVLALDANGQVVISW